MFYAPLSPLVSLLPLLMPLRNGELTKKIRRILEKRKAEYKLYHLHTKIWTMLPLNKTFRNMMYIHSNFYLNDHSSWYMSRFRNNHNVKNTRSYPPKWSETIRDANFRNWGGSLAQPLFDLSSYRQSHWEGYKDSEPQTPLPTFDSYISAPYANVEFLVACLGKR